jgi:hypothetical protein
MATVKRMFVKFVMIKSTLSCAHKTAAKRVQGVDYCFAAFCIDLGQKIAETFAIIKNCKHFIDLAQKMNKTLLFLGHT